MRQTTVGWKFLVKWANGSQQWIELKILKESNAIQVAEYPMASNIREEPAFVWWVPYVLRKQDVIVLFTYYLCMVQTLTKLVTQIRFTLLLGIRLLCYLGASGLT